MRYLVIFPLTLALWGSFARAGLKETGIQCGGFSVTEGYLSLRLIPIGKLFKLVVYRFNGHGNRQLYILESPLTNLDCKITDSPINVKCKGGTIENPQTFVLKERLAVYSRQDTNYQLEARSSAISDLRERGFDGDDQYPIPHYEKQKDVLRMRLVGSNTCRPLEADQLFEGRSVGSSLDDK